MCSSDLLAIGRLEAMVSASALAQAWHRRSLFQAAIKILAADGYYFDVARLFALEAELPLARQRDYGIDNLALAALSRMKRCVGEDEAKGRATDPEEEAAANAIAAAPETDSPRLVACVLGVRRWVVERGQPSEIGRASCRERV